MLFNRLAILGGGNMGRALIGGLLRKDASPGQIAVGEAQEPVRVALEKDFGVTTSADNASVIADADFVLLAVKPQDTAALLAPLSATLQRKRPLVLSVAAGIRIASLQAWCGAGVPIVRAMPNRPALVGAGATGLFAPPEVSSTDRERAEGVMRAVGEVIWVPTEDALDVVTALSGSGPAYFFYLAELMVQAAVEQGLEPEAARRLATATLHGAGLLAQSLGGDFPRLRAEVTSKGGTTEAALRSFDSDALPTIVSRAIAAATRRGRELAAAAPPTPRDPKSG